MITDSEYIDLKKKYPSETNQYEGWEEDYQKIKEHNKALIKKYPFLEPWNRFSGKGIIQCVEGGEEGFWPGAPEKHPDYDYTYTELDNLPDTWRRAFGIQICDELLEELKKYNYEKEYRIMQIKEKWGFLHWYDAGHPIGKLSEDYEMVSKKNEEILERDDNYTYEEDHVDDPNAKERIIKDPSFGEITITDHSDEAVWWYRKRKILEKCKVPDIIAKYEDLSMKICYHCGKPAVYESEGYVLNICEECANKDFKSRFGKDKSEDEEGFAEMFHKHAEDIAM